MINILVIKDNQNIITIEATGHSGYAEAGSDIVCSAVSTLMQNLAVGLMEVLHLSPKVIIDEQIPHMCVELGEKNEQAQLLMKTTVLSLKEIAKGYSNYIKIKEKQR